jgi:hypothetical protein
MASVTTRGVSLRLCLYGIGAVKTGGGCCNWDSRLLSPRLGGKGRGPPPKPGGLGGRAGGGKGGKPPPPPVPPLLESAATETEASPPTAAAKEAAD